VKTWRFSTLSRTYDVTDYGPNFGIQVLRDGFTVWTGYKKGGQFVTDNSALPPRELFAVLEGLSNQDPDRRGQATLFGGTELLPEKKGRARKAERAPVQLDLRGGAARGAPSGIDSRREALAALGPLFNR